MQIDGGKNDKLRGFRRFRRAGHGPLRRLQSCRCGTSRSNTCSPTISSMGAFGGSFLNHFAADLRLRADLSACRQEPRQRADRGGRIRTASSLTLAPDSPKSALDGLPKFVNDGQITPDFYAVNTMQPPYQPSNNKPAPGGDPRLRRSECAEHAAAADTRSPSATC